MRPGVEGAVSLEMPGRCRPARLQRDGGAGAQVVRLNRAIAYLQSHDARFIATNPDPSGPTAEGPVPATGAVAALVAFLMKLATVSLGCAPLLTQYLARELAPSGVRVNAIAPGFFPAEQNRALLSDERVAAILGHTPAGRLGEADELVGAAVWLAAARASSFVTGAIVRVDGGFSAMTI